MCVGVSVFVEGISFETKFSDSAGGASIMISLMIVRYLFGVSVFPEDISFSKRNFPFPPEAHIVIIS